MRRAIDAVRAPDRFSNLRLIRFSDDPIVDDRWFRTREVSIFAGDNSLDIQAIDRLDESYDVIVCSHVIEHVADDRQAIRELTRILSPRGFLILAYPRAEDGGLTEDWGFADPGKNGHYRGYGRDFDGTLAATVPEAQAIALEKEDPVTGDAKKFSFICKSPEWAARILECVPGALRVSGRA